MGKAMQIGSGRHDVDELYLGMQLNAKMEFGGGKLKTMKSEWRRMQRKARFAEIDVSATVRRKQVPSFSLRHRTSQ